MMGNRYLDIKPAKGKNDNNKIAKVIKIFNKNLKVKLLSISMIEGTSFIDIFSTFSNSGHSLQFSN